MPLYEYLCSACAHRFERIVKFSDAPLKICPQCGKSAIEQMISAPAIQFKGSGWYETDYAHKKTPRDSFSSSAKQRSSSDTISASKDSSGGNGTSSDSSAAKSSDPSSNSGSGGSNGGGNSNGGSNGSGGSNGNSGGSSKSSSVIESK